MKATCPNDSTHNKFVTVAHVMEEWMVDAQGHWLETMQTLQTTHGPNRENEWTCHTCGATAKVS